MCCAIPAISWAGLRNGYDSRFPRYCSYPSNVTKSRSTSLSFARLLGPPEIHPLNTCSSDYTRRLPFFISLILILILICEDQLMEIEATDGDFSRFQQED